MAPNSVNNARTPHVRISKNKGLGSAAGQGLDEAKAWEIMPITREGSDTHQACPPLYGPGVLRPSQSGVGDAY